LAEIKPVHACPGDVLLFRMRAGAVAKHLGIMTTSAGFVHAYSGHGVVESALTQPWRRRIAAAFSFEGGQD
jgi:NlpC/P60 family putative phage cell wall peptidase